MSQQRDEHLRSADFFDVATYPEISFQSTSISARGEDQFEIEIEGDLGIHGVTHPVKLNATLRAPRPTGRQTTASAS